MDQTNNSLLKVNKIDQICIYHGRYNQWNIQCKLQDKNKILNNTTQFAC